MLKDEIITVNGQKVYKYVNPRLNIINYQKASYIEEGWVIIAEFGIFKLYEVFEGGEDMLYDEYSSLEEAHKEAISWC